MGQIGSRVQVTGVSDSFPKIARLVGQLRSGPYLVGQIGSLKTPPSGSDRVRSMG